jgi:hypothetical protein
MSVQESASPVVLPARPEAGPIIRGVHVLGVVAILLCAVAVRASEIYTARYQTLPVLDWIESRPPLAEAIDVPAAADLARGLSRTMPLLVISDDARPWLPIFGPPAVIQRTMGGVRDASRIVLVLPGGLPEEEAPVQVRLYAIVFNRTVRATDWTALMGREMDVRDPDSGLSQERMTGPDETDAAWVVSPRQTGGIATVVGHRGPVGFDLQVTLGPTPTVLSTDVGLGTQRDDVADPSARAETIARQAAADWATWVEQQL